MKPKAAHTFHCIDGHTCGNPVRLIHKGCPELEGNSMLDKRQHFLESFDWIRTALMFEPRGHAQMSGSMLYPSLRDDCETGVLFVETSGCLPMCGHGLIGTITIAIEQGLLVPREPGVVSVETPAGKVTASYVMEQGKVRSVRIANVASFLHSTGLQVECPELGGTLRADVAYGGNFYAIIEAQKIIGDMNELSASELLRISPVLRERFNQNYSFVHPEDDRVAGLSHIMWTGKPLHEGSDARNAVFYGDSAIDRSPCGTGTSARMAQLAGKGRLSVGDTFIHESIIGSRFNGRVESAVKAGAYDAIIPSIEGWARVYGKNVITVDPHDDPFWAGFSVT